MNVFEFLDKHPWWGLLYLLIIVVALNKAIYYMKSPIVKKRHKPPFRVEDRTKDNLS